MWSDIENNVRTILNAIDLLKPVTARIILNRNAGRAGGEDLRLYSVGRSNTVIENIDSRFYGIMKSQKILHIPSVSQSRLLSELAVGEGSAVFFPLNSRYGYVGFIWACFPAENYSDKADSIFIGCCEWMEMLAQRWLDDELGVPVLAKNYTDLMDRMQIPAMLLIQPDRMLISNTAFESMKDKEAFMQAFLSEEKKSAEGKSLSEFDYVQQKIDLSEEQSAQMFIFPNTGNDIREIRFGENEIQYYQLLTEKALGSLSLLESSDELTNLQKSYIDKTSMPLRRMEDLFEYGKKHYQRTENSILSFGLLSVTEIAKQVILDLAPAARKKRVEIDLSTDNGSKGHFSGKTVGDPWLLTLAFYNLLDNAIHYSQMDGKAISVQILYDDDDWKFRVEDFGTGISPLDLERMQEQSYAEAAGSGLNGIALVKYVAKAHNGKLMIESRLGKGSVFTLMIPNYQGKA